MYKGDFLFTLQAAISTTITVFNYSYFKHNANDTYLQDIFLFRYKENQLTVPVRFPV
jgi:hypothetical protein